MLIKNWKKVKMCIEKMWNMYFKTFSLYLKKMLEVYYKNVIEIFEECIVETERNKEKPKKRTNIRT